MDEAVRATVQRGHALLEVGRAQEAEAQFRTALAGAPDDPAVHVALAEALLRQERYPEAEQASRATLAADPENVIGHGALVESLIGLDRDAEALEVARRGLALAPHVPFLHVQEAAALLGSGRPEEALVSVGRARALEPDGAVAAAVGAHALSDLGRHDEAQAAVREALRLDPQHPHVLRVQGLVSLRRGGGRDAVDAHRSALRLEPSDLPTREGLSLALKSRNPLYGLLLRYGAWLDRQPGGVRIAMILAPVVLIRLLRPFDEQPWVPVVIAVVVAVVVMSWALEPLMNTVLLLGRDRHVLSDEATRATQGFLGFLAAAVACLGAGLFTDHVVLLLPALAFAVWAIVTGSTHTLAPRRRRVVLVAAVVAALLGVTAVALAWLGMAAAGAPGVLMLLGGVVAMWVTAFSAGR